MIYETNKKWRKFALLILPGAILCGVLGFLLSGKGPTDGDQGTSKVQAPAERDPRTGFYRWGGALNSAATDGSCFFDEQRALALKAAVGADRKYVVHLRARAFLPDPDVKRAGFLEGDEEQIVYVQFYDHPSEAFRRELAGSPVRLLNYLDGYAWHLRGRGVDLAKLRARPEVRGMAQVDPRDKFFKPVFEGSAPVHARTDDGRMRLYALGFSGVDKEGWAAEIRRKGLPVKNAPDSVLGPRLEVVARQEQTWALASILDTQFLEFYPAPAAARDVVLDAASNVDDVRDNAPKLDGSGIKVAIREIDRIIPHVDFSSRYTLGDSGGQDDTTQHATGVAGQVGGDGATRPEAKGIAPKAALLGYELTAEANAFLVADIVDAAAKGARISNHSYGPDEEGDGTYRPASADWDKAIRDHDLLAFFASNERPPADFKQIDYLVGAKNVICVSATHDGAHAGDDVPLTSKADGIAAFADHGPMFDGRIKPDIVANGTTVNLLSGTSSVQVSDGTSFSCPAVAGMAALMFQHYKATFGVEPSATLAKALLLNCATDLGNVGPDATYGYGMANIEQVINLISQFPLAPADNKPWFVDSVSGNESKIFQINVESSGALKVMLVWMDPEKSPAPKLALVNDLDLELQTGLGPVFFPYSLDPNKPMDAATNTVRNSVDNVEQIVLSAPTPGKYSITVRGTSIPAGSQAFAVVVWKNSTLNGTLTAQPSSPGVVLDGSIFLPEEGGDVTYSVAASGGKAPYTFEWDFDGDGTVDRTDAEKASLFTIDKAASYPPGVGVKTVRLNIRDSSAPQNTFQTSMALELLEDPVAEVSAPGSALEGEVPLEVFFSAVGSSGKIQSYQWTFGDGSTGNTTATTISHLYKFQQTYQATLLVTDVLGQTATAQSKEITLVARRFDVFAHKLRANLKLAPGAEDGTLEFIVTVAELAFSRSEAKQALRDDFLTDKTYYVRLDPKGMALTFGPFILDAKGFSQTSPEVRKERQLRIILSRKGQIIGILRKKEIVDLFSSLGMSSDTPSSNKRDPNTFFSIPIEIEQEGAIFYSADFQVVWINGGGKRASAQK